VVGLTDVFRPYPERRGLYRPNSSRAMPSQMPAASAAPRVAAMSRG
jgi:chemotaxis protein methyltransferase CheR